MTRWLSLACLLAAPGAAQAAQSITVDDDGPADFASLQAAVDAAAPGDVIHVAPGGYGPTVIDGKGIAIFATGATVMQMTPSPSPAPALTIRNVPAGQCVIVDGLSAFAAVGFLPACIDVDACAGAVVLQHAFVDSYGGPALRVTASPGVLASDSVFQTNLVTALPDGTPQAAPGALVRAGSNLRAAECTFLGSHGAFIMPGLPTPSSPADGGAGVRIESSKVRLENSDARGGSGAAAVGPPCLQGGDGGHGVEVIAPAGAPALFLHASETVPGSGGFGAGGCPAGVDGKAISAPAGHVGIGLDAARRVILDANITAGQPTTLELVGQPGDLVFLLAAARPAAAYDVNDWMSVALNLEPSSIAFVGALTLTQSPLPLQFTAPALPPGVLLPIAVQSVSQGHLGFIWSGAPGVAIVE